MAGECYQVGLHLARYLPPDRRGDALLAVDALYTSYLLILQYIVDGVPGYALHLAQLFNGTFHIGITVQAQYDFGKCFVLPVTR